MSRVSGRPLTGTRVVVRSPSGPPGVCCHWPKPACRELSRAEWGRRRHGRGTRRGELRSWRHLCAGAAAAGRLPVRCVVDRNDTGRQAVFKWTSDRLWAEQIQRASRAVDAVRRRGYPTPAWLTVGITSSGFGYQVQEYAPGRPREYLTAATARRAVDVLELQKDLDPDPERCPGPQSSMQSGSRWRCTSGGRCLRGSRDCPPGAASFWPGLRLIWPQPVRCSSSRSRTTSADPVRRS